MSFIEDYNDLFDITWHTDSSGNKISKKQTNEQHKIVGNIILLNEIPDQFNRVKISNMYELNKGNKINNANEFVVDYLTGRITFHESKDGATIMVDEYYGRGLIKGFAIRSLLMDKNDNWESDNLEDLAQEIKQYIDTNCTELNADIQSLQGQINTIVVGGTEVDPRVSQALTDYDGIAHPTLKARNDRWDKKTSDLQNEVTTHKAETIHQGKHNTLEATSTNGATSLTNAPLKSAGGLAVAKNVLIGGQVQIQESYFFSKQGIPKGEDEFAVRLTLPNSGTLKILLSSTTVGGNNGFIYAIVLSGASNNITEIASLMKVDSERGDMEISINLSTLTIRKKIGSSSNFFRTYISIESNQPIEEVI